jgi:hypothetical protein
MGDIPFFAAAFYLWEMSQGKADGIDELPVCLRSYVKWIDSAVFDEYPAIARFPFCVEKRNPASDLEEETADKVLQRITWKDIENRGGEAFSDKEVPAFSAFAIQAFVRHRMLRTLQRNIV